MIDISAFDLAGLRPLLLGLATAGTILALGWPFLRPDPLARRLQDADQATWPTKTLLRRGGQDDARTRSKLVVRKPSEFLVQLVDRLSLAKLGSENDVTQLLHMAGVRGTAPRMSFYMARLVGALVMPAMALAYIVLVLKPDWPSLLYGVAGLAAAFLGFKIPAIFLKNLITKRQAAMRRSWPDALDLLLICVEAGMSSEAAFRKVAVEIAPNAPELAEELKILTAELTYLSDRRLAYENLGTRTGLDSIKATVIGLIQSEKYGTSLGQTLRVLAKESRDFRMTAAEKKAAALPPKLTVPMIVFFLPVLFAVIAAPAVFEVMEVWS